MKRGIIRFLALGTLIFLVGIGVWQWQSSSQTAPSEEIVLYGNVDIRQVALAFKVSDRIAEIKVEEGSTVRQGDLLAVLETTRFEHLVTRAEAQVAAQQDEVAKLEAGTRVEEIGRTQAEARAAQVELNDARRILKRLEPLAASDLIPQEQADDAKAAVDAAEARFSAAEEVLRQALAGPRKEDIAAAKSKLKLYEAELSLALQDRSDTSLHAPRNGVIQNRILEAGDMASPQTPVFVLALTDPVWVRTYVPEGDLGRISPGMAARVLTDSFPGKEYKGWIGYISPTAEFTPKSVETPELRTRLVYQVRVFVCNPENELLLGMPATVIIPLDQEEPQDTVLPCGDK